MNTSISRDRAEVEPLSPSPELLLWRETRDADRFRQWCLDNLGGYVRVGEHEFHPAVVLTLKEGAVDKAREECKQQLREQDEETVCSQFPSPIAVPFHQFLQGPRDPTKRLLRMRDTWEGMIHLLWSLAIAEAAQIGISGIPIQVNDRDSRRMLRAKDLRSDSMAVRIAVLDGIVDHWRRQGVRSVVVNLIPTGVVDELRRLNAVRNGFSHMGAPSDTQAKRLIEEWEPMLHESLVDLLDLTEVQLFRLIRITPGSTPTAEVEPLIGHARSRSVRDLPLDSETAQIVMKAGRVGALDRVLARVGARIFDLSPYLYSCDDNTGHHTLVLFFKRIHNGLCQLEVVGESHTIPSEASFHKKEFSRCEEALLPVTSSEDHDG